VGRDSVFEKQFEAENQPDACAVPNAFESTLLLQTIG